MYTPQQILTIFSKLGQVTPWLCVLFVFIGAMIFLVVPQLKRLRAHSQIMSQLKVGDRVVTNGGLIGILTEVDRELLLISFSSLEPIPILRSAIERTLPCVATIA